MQYKGFYFSCIFVGIGCSETSIIEEKPPATKTCEAEIINTTPYPESVDMYYRAKIEVELSQPDPEASITLTDNNGENVSGSMTFADKVIGFQPDLPLQPSHSYLAKLQYCGSAEPVEIPFTTSMLGTPLDGGNELLVGRTYSVDLASGNVLAPLGVGDILQGILQNTFLISVRDQYDDRLDVRFALSKANSLEQDFCVPTLEQFPLIDLSDSPHFVLDYRNIPIIVSRYAVTIYDFKASGTVAPDASYFGWIEADGVIDGRELYPVLQGFGLNVANEEDFCTLLESVGHVCQECPLDDRPYCLPIKLDQVEATEESLDIFPVCQSKCHALCDDNEETCTDPQQQTDVCD